MKRVPVITSARVELLKLPHPFHPLMAVSGSGEVPTTGWTQISLSRIFSILPPEDGLMDFALIGEEPSGIVGQVVLPVSANTVVEYPRWCKGIRIHGDKGSVKEAHLQGRELPIELASAMDLRDLRAGHVIVQQHLASYEDSWQPTGKTKFDPWPHTQWKKLHHDLVLIVEGPNEAQIRSCVNRAIAAGLVAAIVAACATGGAALPAAISAFLTELESCLGNAFSARVENHSYWVYWWT